MAKRVMVVDDSRMICMQMKNLLQGTDYEVAAYCRDGEEAVAQYGEVAPDLVTMEGSMPWKMAFSARGWRVKRGIR